MGVYFSTKPKGKCSHGGKGDLTSTTVPRGGIHKDVINSENVALHKTAVLLATTASLQLLEDIRLAVGDKDFLRMMGIARSSVLVFVIDTTGSMSDDIDEARKVVFEIIDSKKGTQDEPSEYILVPFNDPGFGPLSKTEDPDKIKKLITDLKPNGGGDIPEMCLSALQLALTGSPSSSHIYVFTDAIAKDISLKDTIIALIRRTKSTVSFFMTGSSRRRRRSATASFDDYREMALASGGQAIDVSKKQLPQATAIIRDTSTSALVTILQRTVIPAASKTTNFVLDESLQNVTMYITGQSVTYTITNPAGVTQSNTDTSGKLGTASSVGNLVRIRLNDDKQLGKWQILTNSPQPYTVKVTGQSIITFIYNFVERFEGPHPGYAVLSGRPQAGEAAHLLLSAIGKKGPSSMKIGDIGLISSSDKMENATITDLGNGDILAMVKSVPEGEFLVVMTGTDKESNSEFQRQSTTSMSVSKVNIQAHIPSSMEPGVQVELPFVVKTQGAGGEYSIVANNDRDYPMVYPKKITLTTGKEVNDTVKITPPGNTPSGTDVTLTMEAKSSDGADSNYIVLRLSVIKKITDFYQPLCEDLSVKADDCPMDLSLCAPHQWEMSANLTDGNGTGIESVTLRQGNGSLTVSPVPNRMVKVSYKASCCSQIVEVVAVDAVGNVGKCYHSIERSAGPPLLTLSLPLWLCLLVSIFVARP
uniref:von Willebrand factor A domain-containing protein 7-like n=2 Tax=Cynoglossus semilaevis TaxID=244447 RepID=A0A3P8VXE8_CYNSE